jgi:hypothetical protein
MATETLSNAKHRLPGLVPGIHVFRRRAVGKDEGAHGAKSVG